MVHTGAEMSTKQRTFPNPNFLVRISPGGVRHRGGLPSERVGAKKFGLSPKPREPNFLAGHPGILAGHPGILAGYAVGARKV